MTHCFQVYGDNTAIARYKATDIADKLGSAHVDYDKLKKCNEDDMEAVLKSVKLPRDTEKDQMANMILGEIIPKNLLYYTYFVTIKGGAFATGLNIINLRFRLQFLNQLKYQH